MSAETAAGPTLGEIYWPAYLAAIPDPDGFGLPFAELAEGVRTAIAAGAQAVADAVWDDVSDGLKTAITAGVQAVLSDALPGLRAKADDAYAQLAAAEAERDKAYRERAALVAYLAACYPSEIRDAGSEWPVIYVQTPSGQMSWHLSRADLELFPHLPHSNKASLARWDGHSAEQKYDRLAELARTVATGLYGPQPGSVDDEYRITDAGRAVADAQPAEPPKRYALVEQMGYRHDIAAVREITFAGKQLIELTRLDDPAAVRLISPDSLYGITWLTEDEARRRAKPWTAAAAIDAGLAAWTVDETQLGDLDGWQPEGLRNEPGITLAGDDNDQEES